MHYLKIMNEYERADQSSNTMSNIIPLSSDNIIPMQDILQCSLCTFTTSNRYITII